MQLVNMFFGFMASQRGVLYGLPMGFAIVSTLLVAVRMIFSRTAVSSRATTATSWAFAQCSDAC